jgi:hypothetical protein
VGGGHGRCTTKATIDKPEENAMNDFRSASVLLVACALAACSRSPIPKATEGAINVAGISLGRAIAADKTVADPIDSFRPMDTIYVSVRTEGGAASSARLSARWTFEDGQLVGDSTQTIAASGPAVTEFHVSKTDGWPAGRYKVEVSLDGAPAGHRDFSVKQEAL